MSRQITDAEALHLLRRQRHSFLNHLQVISGWLQLGRSERAQQYLETVAARMTGESDVLRQAPANLSLLVLELGLEAETHGVPLDWQFGSGGGPVPAVTEEQLAGLRQRVLAELAAGAAGGLVIRLAGGVFSVHTPTGKGEG